MRQAAAARGMPRFQNFSETASREVGGGTWRRVALRQPLVGESARFSLLPFRLGWMREIVAFTPPDCLLFSPAGGGDESIRRTECDCVARRRKWSRLEIDCRSGEGVLQGSRVVDGCSPSGC